MSRSRGIRFRMKPSTFPSTQAPHRTAITPPRPLHRMEFTGSAALYSPASRARVFTPSSPVIIPSIPPRMGVAPNRPAAL